MAESTLTTQLSTLLDGWQGYNQSIIAAVEPLTAAHLVFRPAANLRSTGELVRHIALGRITWFARMAAPGSAAVAAQVLYGEPDSDGNRDVIEEALAVTEDAAALVGWLQTTWQMVEQTLATWGTSDLAQTYPHLWNGQMWAVSRQWTLFRILAHDIHHGGELALMLGLQGLEPFELGALGGHIILPATMDGAPFKLAPHS